MAGKIVREKNIASNPAELATDICCCFFLSVGLLLSLYKVMPSEPAFPWAFCAFPLAVLLFVALFGRRLLVTLGAAAALLLLLNLRQLPMCLETARAFLR